LCDVAFILYHRSKPENKSCVVLYYSFCTCVFLILFYVKKKETKKTSRFKQMKKSRCRVDEDLSFFSRLFSVLVIIIILDLLISCLSSR
jgi:Ca2+/Na+ antiporter